MNPLLNKIPNYITERICRPIPPDLHIIEGSTPVVSFGDSRTATVATIGLNPSNLEFLDKDASLLGDEERRFETHESLGVYNMQNASSDIVRKVLDKCNNYFLSNPYKWFNELEKILKECEFSYHDGSACHLDRVQWATDLKWSKLKPLVKKNLLKADNQFLLDQLSNKNIKLLLVNGAGVFEDEEPDSLNIKSNPPYLIHKYYEEVIKTYTITKEKESDNSIYAGELQNLKYMPRKTTKVEFCTGKICGDVHVIQWNINLQATRGPTNLLRRAIAEQIREKIASLPSGWRD